MIAAAVFVVIVLMVARMNLAHDLNVPPMTVDQLNVDQYLGRWYQMYSSLIPNSTFEKYGYCITADYYKTDITGAVFGITNAQRYYGPSGKLETVDGYATQPSGDPGKFVITFDSTQGHNIDYYDPNDETMKIDNMYSSRIMSQMKGNYWVIALGDPEPDKPKNPYPWAVVSQPFGLMLFILARDVELFRERYENEVLKLVKKKGFIFPFNKPLETYQGSSCQYAPEPKP
eukprot:gene33835-40938_t